MNTAVWLVAGLFGLGVVAAAVLLVAARRKRSHTDALRRHRARSAAEDRAGRR